MKRIVSFCLILLSLSACNMEEEMGMDNAILRSSKKMLTAVIEDPQTKTSFVDNQASTIKLQWQGVESFGLYDGTQLLKYSRTGGNDFVTDGNLGESDHYYGYYPYSAIKEVTANGFKVEFPKQQEFVKNNLEDDMFPMTGTWVDDHMSFKNLCSVLAFGFKAPEGSKDLYLESVTVTTDKAIAGEAVIPFGTTDVQMASSGSKSVVLNCSDILLSDKESTTCYVVLPPGHYSKLSVAFLTSDMVSTEYTLEGDLTFQRSTLYATSEDKLGQAQSFYTITFEGDYWDALIDSQQYGGELLYGVSGMGDDYPYYSWTDSKTTLYSEIVNAWGSYCYWSGGSAISDYLGNIADGSYTTQLMIPSSLGAHSGKNFAVQYGYMDASGFASDGRPTFFFSDEKARVIKGFYITNTCYGLHSLDSGDSFSTAATEDTFIKAVIYCFNDPKKGFIGSDWEQDEQDACYKAEVLLCDGTKPLQEWAFVDLTEAGAITSFKINYEASEDMGGSYGLNWPAYCAIDDIMVGLD